MRARSMKGFRIISLLAILSTICVAVTLSPARAARMIPEEAVARAVEFAGAVSSHYADYAPQLTAILGGDYHHPDCWQILLKSDAEKGRTEGGYAVRDSTGWIIEAGGPGSSYKPKEGEERISPAQAAKLAEQYVNLALGGPPPANYPFWGIVAPGAWPERPLPLDTDPTTLKNSQIEVWWAKWERVFQGLPFPASINVGVNAYTGQLSLIGQGGYDRPDPEAVEAVIRSEEAVKVAQQFALQEDGTHLGFPTGATLKIIAGPPQPEPDLHMEPNKTYIVWELNYEPYYPRGVAWISVKADTGEVAEIVRAAGGSEGPAGALQAPKEMPKPIVPAGWEDTEKGYRWTKELPGNLSALWLPGGIAVAVILFAGLVLRPRLLREGVRRNG